MRTRTTIAALSLFAGAPAFAEEASPLFHRHVAAVFSRLGCNGGTCHGAVKGQNGFRLSLFGADPVGRPRAGRPRASAAGA